MGWTGPGSESSVVVNTVSASSTLARAKSQLAYIANGGWTVTMPADPVNGDIVAVKSIDNSSSIIANTGQTIDGSALAITVLENVGLVLYWHSGSSKWLLIGSYAP